MDEWMDGTVTQGRTLQICLTDLQSIHNRCGRIKSKTDKNYPMDLGFLFDSVYCSGLQAFNMFSIDQKILRPIRDNVVFCETRIIIDAQCNMLIKLQTLLVLMLE